MRNAIASQLETVLDSNTTLIPWQELESEWKRKIEGGIRGKTPPSHLVYPDSQASLSKVIKAAYNNHWTVLACGSGSKLSWGGLVKDPQIVISTYNLDHIIDHAGEDLTVTVEAGVKLADLQQKLQPFGQFLPLDPAYPESATIGGIVATADGGSWRQRYGGVRDLVLGLSFIRSDGEIAKAGGKVVKNVAGYDLMKLFAGSYGTLGIISQVTLRLYPLPEASTTLLVNGEGKKIAIATQTLIQSSLTPTAADLLSTPLVNQLGGEGEMGLILRWQSIPASISEQSSQIETLAQELGLQVRIYQGDEEKSLWQRLEKTREVANPAGAIACKIGILPTKAILLLQELEQLTANQGLGKINISSGVGRLYLDLDRNFDRQQILAIIKKLRSLCQTNRGFLTLLEAPASLKQELEPWGYNGNALLIMRQLKQKFDPKNILNPGCFVGGI
jgi:glycolate oxidase FAD binding subunit